MTGFLTLIERECYRFGRLAVQTIAPAVISTMLFIVIFGYSLGGGIREIAGHSYILYILPGLIGMGIITNSYSNSSTSLFMARIDRSIEGILVSPISPFQVVAAFVIGGILRGFTVGAVTLAAASLLTNLSIHSYAETLFFFLAVSTIFSSLGVISALLAQDWDHLATFSNFVITPFVYLGGVFFSVKMLPPFWQKVSAANPMLYLIDGFRFAILGISDTGRASAVAVTLGFAAASLGTAIWLFRRGFRLVV